MVECTTDNAFLGGILLKKAQTCDRFHNLAKVKSQCMKYAYTPYPN